MYSLSGSTVDTADLYSLCSAIMCLQISQEHHSCHGTLMTWIYPGFKGTA